MFKAAIRVNKITSIAQLRGATLHAERHDKTGKARVREGAEPGHALAWSKADTDRDYLAAFKAHKVEMGAKERKGAPLCMQALCVVSPEWVQTAGDLHDADNPHNRKLFDQAKAWAESWAGEGAVFGARLDLDERGGAVVDLMISPVRDSRGKPVISTQKALTELKGAAGERNEYSALQTSWADWARDHLDHSIVRGTRKEITQRQHMSPETYGLVKDQTRAEAAQERVQRGEVATTLAATSEMTPEAIEELRDYLLLQREAQRHKHDPEGYEPPFGKYGMDDASPHHDPWRIINDIRSNAERVLEVRERFGVSFNDDKDGYEAGRKFFPNLVDRMHLTAALAKCAAFCARVEAFVKNLCFEDRGISNRIEPKDCTPWGAQEAVERNERNLGLRPPLTEDREHETETRAEAAERNRISHAIERLGAWEARSPDRYDLAETPEENREVLELLQEATTGEQYDRFRQGDLQAISHITDKPIFTAQLLKIVEYDNFAKGYETSGETKNIMSDARDLVRSHFPDDRERGYENDR